MKWILRIALALALGTAAAPSHAQDVVAPAQFRDEVIDLLRSERADLCVRIADDWTVYFGPDAAACEHVLATENMYREYARDPSRKADLQGRLARMGLAMMAGPPDTSNFRNRLVVVLRPEGYASILENSTAVHRPFAGDMIAVLMLDSPETLAAMGPEALSDHNLSEAEAFELAEANLKDRIGEVRTTTELGIEIVEAESGLATGLLWLPDSCRSESEGDQALVFDRNGYLRVGTDDRAAIQSFRMVAEGSIADNATLSRSVIVCRAGSWVAADAL